MRPGARLPGAGLLLLLGSSGCPMTDDYYLESSPIVSTSGNQGLSGAAPTSGGSHAGQGGTAGGGVAGGSAGAMGGSDLPQAGASGSNGGGSGCTASTERCNGHDDDCDELIDELACNSVMNGTMGCSGFVLPGSPNHGYMLCTAANAQQTARAACAAQNMRLAWLETAAENAAVAKKVAALSNDAEVLFGANDVEKEGEWVWDGGALFWKGDDDGKPVDGLFNAWTEGTPNNENDDEDCAVLLSAPATWGDRSCDAKYSYLCEEVTP